MNDSSRKLANDFLDSMPGGVYTYDDLCNLEMLLDQHAAEPREATDPYDILLGNGDTIVTDIHNDEYGWAGICFSPHDCPVGEFYDTAAKTDIELEAFMRIITSNPDSLNVVIAACERAKVHLNAMMEKSDE